MIKMLRLKFLAVTMAIVTVLMGVIFGLVIHFTAEALERESLETLRSVATGQFQLITPETLPAESETPFFTVRLGPMGQLTTDLRGEHSEAAELWLQEVLTAALAQEVQTGVLEGYGLRFYRTDDLFGTQLVFADITSERETMQHLTVSCALISLGGLIAFGAAAYVLSGWMVRPVEQAFREQRQFVADASHELKTPLTVILTNAELLQNPEYSLAQHRQFRSSILTVGHQMRSLIENLLDLARIDNGSLQGTFAPVDFSELCEEELLPWEPVFFEHDLTVESALEPGIRVSGSEGHLRQVVSVLLDNARKYSTPGGSVRMTLRRQGARTELSVDSPGAPMSQQELERIFLRFYRVDKARTAGSGYGLGLPIARQIIEGHGGRIWAESANGRNIFRVQLPISR